LRGEHATGRQGENERGGAGFAGAGKEDETVIREKRGGYNSRLFISACPYRARVRGRESNLAFFADFHPSFRLAFTARRRFNLSGEPFPALLPADSRQNR
jgi:hypothetical protein